MMKDVQISQKDEDNTKHAKLNLIRLILDPKIDKMSNEQCGALFDKLYDKSLAELNIYYTVFCGK